MSEPMKVQTIGDFAELSIKIPLERLDEIRSALESVLALIDDSDGGNGNKEELSTFEELFPDFHAGNALRGARTREGLTQAQLAALIGVQPTHISGMERGKRPIGKEMAKRLGKVLRIGYKVFL
jgi:ribosome-binding protein aMBF1 (putative translation factor)